LLRSVLCAGYSTGAEENPPKKDVLVVLRRSSISIRATQVRARPPPMVGWRGVRSADVTLVLLMPPNWSACERENRAAAAPDAWEGGATMRWGGRHTVMP
jgi:hypothetical protein